ncbi:MAG: IS200/IS605 family transposase [bacterium]
MNKQIGIRRPRTEVRGLPSRIYHVWFSPKRRKKALQGDIDRAAKRHFASIAADNDIVLLAMETKYDHVHLLLQTPDGMSLPHAVKRLKGATARYLFLEFPELRLDLGEVHFGQRGYGFRIVEPGAEASVVNYIKSHRSHQQPRTSVRGRDSFEETLPSKSHHALTSEVTT